MNKELAGPTGASSFLLGAQGPGMWYTQYTDQDLGSSALCHQELWVKDKLPKSMMGETQNGHSAPHWGPPRCPTEINHIFCSAGDCNQDFVLVRHILSDETTWIPCFLSSENIDLIICIIIYLDMLTYMYIRREGRGPASRKHEKDGRVQI